MTEVETQTARFLLLALLSQPLFSEVDKNGVMKNALRNDEPVNLTHKEIRNELAIPLIQLRKMFDIDDQCGFTTAEIARLLKLESARM